MESDSSKLKIFPTHLATPAAYGFEHRVAPVIRELLKQGDETILDVGCGSGVWRFLLAQGKKYVGMDVADGRFSSKQNSDAQFVLADSHRCPFRDASFDFVLLNNMLQYVDDDAMVMQEAFRILKAHRFCSITAPTYLASLSHVLPFLPYAVLRRRLPGKLHHHYTLHRLLEICSKAGLEVVKVTPSYGLFVALTQSAFTHLAMARWYWLKLMSKVFHRGGPVSMFNFSAVYGATDLTQVRLLRELEERHVSRFRSFYSWCLTASYILDAKLGRANLAAEWFVVCRKP